MPSTINIWQEAEMEDKGAQTGGTWTYTGNITPAPTPPSTYNGTADFTGLTVEGNYEFTYTTTNGTATDERQYTVTYSLLDPRINDDCSSSQFITIPAGTPFQVTVEDNLDSACPDGCDPATDSGTTKPTEWGSGTFTGDVWYEFIAPSSSTNYFIQVEVTGVPFGENGIDSPLVELWIGNPGKQAILTASVPSPNSKLFKIRVSSLSGNEGAYEITIKTI